MLTDVSFFLWEFTPRMTLVRKGVLEHVSEKPDTLQQSSTWKVDDLKALAIIVELLSPSYQTMERHYLRMMRGIFFGHFRTAEPSQSGTASKTVEQGTA